MRSLIQSFLTLHLLPHEPEWFVNKAIFSAINDAIDTIEEILVNKVSRILIEYVYTDKTKDACDRVDMRIF